MRFAAREERASDRVPEEIGVVSHNDGPVTIVMDTEVMRNNRK